MVDFQMVDLEVNSLFLKPQALTALIKFALNLCMVSFYYLKRYLKTDFCVVPRKASSILL